MTKYSPAKIDYSGRTVDILLLKTVLQPQSETIVKPDVSDNPLMVTGIEKLVQRFAILFLTQLDTVKNCEQEGTEFMTSLGSGHIYDDSTLRSAAAAANKRVASQIKKEDSALDTRDDEALYDSVVKDLSLDRSNATVSVSIEITTVAGDKYTYITPIVVGV